MLELQAEKVIDFILANDYKIMKQMIELLHQ